MQDTTKYVKYPKKYNSLWEVPPDIIPNRVLVRFSCGASSAVAGKLAIAEWGDKVEVVYFDTGGEHEDNKRFLVDVEQWYGYEIQIIKNQKYIDHWDVFEKTRYIKGVKGARCTLELKRSLGDLIKRPGDLMVLGFDADEKSRADDFRESFPDEVFCCPLIEANLTKANCKAILEAANIKLPLMYDLGFTHNNCIGCCKGGMGYWNKIKKHFPDTFERMANLQRELQVTTVTRKGQRIYLDQLNPEDGKDEVSDGPECNGLCEKIMDQLCDI